MIVINAIVIYFAFGVPFGVLAASHERRRLQPIDVWRVFCDLAFWPILLLLRVGQGGSRMTSISSPELDSEARALRRKLRSEVVTLKGLQTARRVHIRSTNQRIPFDGIIDHPNRGLASKCFRRTNISKLNRHIAAAEDRIKSIADQSAAMNLKLEELFFDSKTYEEFMNSPNANRV